MSTTCLAGIDIGTTGAKAMIFDLDGNVLGSAYREYACDYPKPNWVEQQADQVVNRTFDVVREAIRDAGVPAAGIHSVSVSAQRCCAIFLDRDEQQLRPMISWQDSRTPAEVAEIAARVDPGEYYQRTGFPNGTTWLLSKLLWVRKNQPEVWERLDRVVQMHDYFLRALGVEDYVVDHNDAGFFGFFDSTRCQWDSELLQRFDLSPDILPGLARSGTPAGTVSTAGAERSGLAVGTPIAIGAGDQCAGSLGAGVIEPGDLSISMGTAGAVTAYLDHVYRDPAGQIMITNHGLPDCWLLEGYQAAAASVYRWFRDELAGGDVRQAEAAGRDPYDVLNERAATAPPGSKGLLLLPYFAGAATPRYNPHARGALVGLTFAHDKACLTRAFMEGITLDMMDMIQAMRSAAVTVEQVRVLGGPTRSPLWNQIQADTYGVPVHTLKVPDATVIGAAILGAVGAGVYASIPEAVRHMVRVEKTFEPDPARVPLYRDLYAAYVQTYEALSGGSVFDTLAGIQGS